MDDEFPVLTPELTGVQTTRGRLVVAQIHLGPFPRGAAVLLHEDGGRRRADAMMNQLARHGYESLSVDISDWPAQVDLVVTPLLRLLADRQWRHEQTAVVGYGTGAVVALLAATKFRLGAAVSVAPLLPGAPIQQAEEAFAALRTPWLGLTSGIGSGAEEALARLDSIRRSCAPVHTELVRYHTVPQHFYTDIGDARAYAAAFDSWQRVLEWLDARVVPRLSPASLAWQRRLPADTATP